jgi:chromosome partitioning protein
LTRFSTPIGHVIVRLSKNTTENGMSMVEVEPEVAADEVSVPRKLRRTVKLLIAGPKGGPGKSTISQNLAAVAAYEGYNVAVVDFDLQRSLAKWVARRPDTAAHIHPYEGDPNNVEDAQDVVGLDGHDVIFIDTPPSIEHHPETLKTLALAADLIIVPSRFGPKDMESAEPWVKLLNSYDVQTLIVLNSVKTAARNRVLNARRRLAAVGNLSAIEIPDYDDFLTADENGLGVAEIRSAKGAADIAALWASVRNLVRIK